MTTATHTTTYFGKQVFLTAAYTTNTTKSPKTIDLTAKGQTQLGIYEIAGNTVKIRFAAPGKPRPTDYQTRPGDGRTSAVMETPGKPLPDETVKILAERCWRQKRHGRRPEAGHNGIQIAFSSACICVYLRP